MERIEIMVRLVCAEVSSGMEVSTPKEHGERADKLIAEDAKRTAAETRPDRPAKVEGKAKCDHRFVRYYNTEGNAIEKRCDHCGEVVNTPPAKVDAPRVKWRPGTELPPENTACLIDGNVEAGGALVNGGHYGIGFYNGGGRWFIPFAGDVTPKRWLPLKEIV